MVLEMKWTAQDYADALDTLQRAYAYLETQYYGPTMPPDEAKAHFDARALLLRHRLMTCDEMGRIFCGK